jgi:hypothetical protein
MAPQVRISITVIELRYKTSAERVNVPEPAFAVLVDCLLPLARQSGQRFA